MTIPLSQDAGSQGKWWKEHYNTESGKGTAAKFTSEIIRIDYKRKNLFAQKAAQCHIIAQGGKHKQGPNLFGVCKRKAGKSPNFSYTQAVEGSGITWTEETSGQYLQFPNALIPGAKMIFAGLKKELNKIDLT